MSPRKANTPKGTSQARATDPDSSRGDPMMDAATTARPLGLETEDRAPALAVGQVLDAIRTWRVNADNARKSEVETVRSESARLEREVEALQEQLLRLARRRVELEAGHDLDVQESERARDSIVDTLTQQADQLRRRALRYTSAEQARQAVIRRALDEDDAIRELYADWRNFDEANLQGLPKTYRAAIVQHHRATEKDLAAFITERDPGQPDLKESTLMLDLVFSVDTEPGQPELVSVVLPVREEVYIDWADRSDDVQLHVAARTVQALYEIAGTRKQAAAHVACGGHKGLLAVELEVPSADEDLETAVKATLIRVFTEAPEMAGAKIEVRATPVPADYLLPPDPDAEVENA